MKESFSGDWRGISLIQKNRTEFFSSDESITPLSPAITIATTENVVFLGDIGETRKIVKLLCFLLWTNVVIAHFGVRLGESIDRWLDKYRYQCPGGLEWTPCCEVHPV